MSEKKKMSIKDEIGKIEAENVEVPLETSDSVWMKIITAESPDKDIPDYDNHPLNYDHMQSTGRIIRGLEGMIGNLDRALVDLVLGVVQKVFSLYKGKEG